MTKSKVGIPTGGKIKHAVVPHVIPAAVGGAIYGIGAHGGVIGALIGAVVAGAVTNDETITKIAVFDLAESITQPQGA